MTSFNTELNKFSRVGMGTMGYGGYFSSNDTHSRSEYIKLIDAGYDIGYRIIDTAEIYGNGEAENIIGQIAKSKKNNMFIMSKFSPENSQPENIELSLNNSLKRLNRDYIDVYQPHWPTENVPLYMILECLDNLVKVGKIKYIGLSNFSYDQYIKANKLLGDNKVKFLQTEYNPFERSVEKLFYKEVDSNKSYLVAYSPFRNGDVFNLNEVNKTLLNEICLKYDASFSEIILAWILRLKSVIVIPKTSSLKRLKENFKAQTLTISDDDIEIISSCYYQKINNIPLSEISVEKDGDRIVYRTIEEAKQNSLRLSPGPVEIAREIKANGGELSKPIKVKRNKNKTGKKFILIEGRVKFWGWHILYNGKKSIPSIIIN